MKKLFLLTLLFSAIYAYTFCAFPVFAQEVAENESAIFLDDSTESVSNDPVIETASSIGILVRMIVVLIIVIAIIFAIFALMKKTMTQGNDDDPFLRKVSSIILSPGKSVQVITLLDKAYLIGVSENAVNLIGEVEDKELVDAMNVYADKNSKVRKPQNFNEVLSLFMPNGFRVRQTATEKETSVYGDLANERQNILKKQYDRLKGEDGGSL